MCECKAYLKPGDPIFQEVLLKIQFALVLTAVSSAFGHGQGPKLWDGFATNTHCGTHCQRTLTMTPDLACVRLCVKRGSKYGLWSGDHVYILEPKSRTSKFAAENVRVTGDLANDTIQIKSISLVKQKTSQSQLDKTTLNLDRQQRLTV